MKPSKAAAIAGGLALTALGFFLVGRWTRADEDWSRQHINKSSNPKEFRNGFLGLSLRAPDADGWELVCDPARLRHTPSDVNKVLEINRMLTRGSPDQQWARMDIFVEPFGAVTTEQVLRRLEFRSLRPGFKVVAGERKLIGGKPAAVRLGAWAVKGKRYSTINYHLEHDGKLYAFIGVTQADAFKRFRPVFDQIIASACLD